MKPKTMILMVVAVVCGLGASYMTSKLLAERNKEQNEPTVPVLVAKMKVASWQPIRDPEKFFEIRQFPVSVAPNKPLGDYPEILNQRLNKPIDEGKPVSQADLLTKEQTSMAENLQSGQRAIAIKVTPESLAGGFVLPGTRVDVVLTTKGGIDVSARIMLQNMLVLAVDTQDDRRVDQRTVLGQTVTLAVTPEEATRLSLATSQGELRLLLKNGADQSRTYNVVSKLPDLQRPLQGESDRESDLPRGGIAATPLPELKDEPRPEPAAPMEVKKPEPPKKSRHVMKITNGTSIEKAVFLLGDTDEDEDEDAVKPEAKKPEAKKPEPPKPAPAPATPPAPTGKPIKTIRP